MKKFLMMLVKPKIGMAHFLIGLSLAGLAFLAHMGWLQPVMAYLDTEKFAFYLSGSRVSLYLIVKSTFVIFLLFWVVGAVINFIERRIAAMPGLKARSRSLILKAAQILIYFVAFLIGLDLLGIDLTTLTIFSGAVGIGVGFGLQKITSNFISGLILLVENSVENEDLVELGTDIFGFVKHTGARFTLVETFDGKEVMIPNEDFITNRVVNWTFSNKQGRVEIIVGVSYNSDLERAIELVLEAALEAEHTSLAPQPVCYATDFGDSSINLLLYFWVDDVTKGRFEPKSQVIRAIHRKFGENGIIIPFPQRDIHLKSEGT